MPAWGFPVGAEAEPPLPSRGGWCCSLGWALSPASRGWCGPQV